MNANVDTEALAPRLDALSAQIAWLVERQRRQEELLSEMTPILREVMATATARLDDLEKRGWFRFGRELGAVAERILDHYSAEDVKAFGDAVVSILDTIRALTQPEVLSIVGEASQGLQKADEVEPIGLVGMVRASRHEDVQKGMAVLMDVLRHVGRAAEAMAKRRAPEDDRKARLAAALGPRRTRALGTERPAPGQLRPPAPPPPAARCTTPSEQPAVVAAVIDGVGFTADGHLADPSVWTPALAEQIAQVQGVKLTAAHWKLVEQARAEYLATKAAPNLRRLTLITGVSTRDIYTLFPKAPGRTIARIAGTPKPVGCV